MYLKNIEYGLEEFLSSLNFIAPPGTTVAYFVTPPEGVVLPEGSPFESNEESANLPPDESITYMRVSKPFDKIDQARSPEEYFDHEVPTLGRRPPEPEQEVMPSYEVGSLRSPYVQVLSESFLYGTDIKLLERYKMFPKNTLFHCVRKKVK
jgi:hypothetical protein